MKWFDRKFDFNLTVENFPRLVKRLASTPEHVSSIARDAPEAILIKRDGDRWSIQENIGHLLDLEKLWFGRVDDILNKRSVLRAADLTNKETHEADHNTRSIETILNQFQAERTEFVDRVSNLPDVVLLEGALHPRLKQPMRLLDLVYFVVEHDDHHLKEIHLLSELFGKQ